MKYVYEVQRYCSGWHGLATFSSLVKAKTYSARFKRQSVRVLRLHLNKDQADIVMEKHPS